MVLNWTNCNSESLFSSLIWELLECVSSCWCIWKACVSLGRVLWESKNFGSPDCFYCFVQLLTVLLPLCACLHLSFFCCMSLTNSIVQSLNRYIVLGRTVHHVLKYCILNIYSVLDLKHSYGHIDLVTLSPIINIVDSLSCKSVVFPVIVSFLTSVISVMSYVQAKQSWKCRLW